MAPPMSSAARGLRARLAAYALHATHDPAQTTAARRAFMARFEAQVDPGGVLSEGERQRRAKAER